MTNKFSKAYEILDNGIMLGVNNLVKAWNWTTGRTRADLSNVCRLGEAFFCSKGFYEVNPETSWITTTGFLFALVDRSLRNWETDECEAEALEFSLKNPEVEKLKKNILIMGRYMGA